MAILLHKRLSTAAKLCSTGTLIIDVGCDHGYLPAHLLSAGKFRKAILTDINEKPLESASATFENENLSDKAEFLLCDGLSGISPSEDFVISVCGMGGELIATILDEGKNTARRSERLVLQPMSRPEALRSYLSENGYEILSETVVTEEEKVYLIICSRYTGENTSLSFSELLLGEEDKLEGELIPYYERSLAAYEEIKKGKNTAGIKTEKEEKIICEIMKRYALIVSKGK